MRRMSQPGPVSLTLRARAPLEAEAETSTRTGMPEASTPWRTAFSTRGWTMSFGIRKREQSASTLTE
jgi:hypothetical protein